jgi:hypothetical protein
MEYGREDGTVWGEFCGVILFIQEDSILFRGGNLSPTEERSKLQRGEK